MTRAPLFHPPGPAVLGRVADVQLRGRGGPLRARMSWPGPPGSEAAPALLVCFPPGGLPPWDADPLSRALGVRFGAAVLTLPWPARPGGPADAAVRDAVTALEWAADHAAELGADPGRLLVAGEGPGAGLAAAVALHARDQGWPPLGGQLLLLPVFAPGPSSPLRAASLAGVAPATVVTAADDPAGEDGRRYAARLRAAGVEVEEVSRRQLLEQTGGP